MTRLALAALLFACAAGAHADDAPALRCTGETPSWRLDLAADAARLTLDDTPRDYTGTAQGSLDTRLIWRGGERTADLDLVAFVSLDRRGGDDRDWQASLALPDGTMLSGRCARVAVSTAAAPPEQRNTAWWDEAAAIYPAMRTCLARSTGPEPRVTKLWHRDDGGIGMRTRNVIAAWWSCELAPDGRVEHFAPLPEDGPGLPGEGVVIFSPAGNLHPPVGACYQFHRPVHGADGALLGWLSDLVC